MVKNKLIDNHSKYKTKLMIIYYKQLIQQHKVINKKIKIIKLIINLPIFGNKYKI